MRFLFLNLIFCLCLHASEWGPYEFESKPGGVIAIGDIHADSEAFVDALVGNGILDREGNFIAQGKDIVFLGDFTDKGPNTLAVWDIMNYVKKEASKNNSRVHSLFGNHDTVVLMGELKRMYPEDLERFTKYDADPVVGVQRALVSEPYKELMQGWRTMIKIDDTLYVHGGVDDWMLETTPEEINNTVNKYVKDQQSYLEKKLRGEPVKAPEVPKVLEPWIFDSEDPFPDNPFWSRELSHGNIESEKLDEILKELEVKRVVVGHTPTKSKAIEVMYDNRLYRVDTNISRGFKNGQISGLHLSSDGKVKELNDLPRGSTLGTYSQLMKALGATCLQKSLSP